MRSFLLMQLTFNVLILVSLMLLARRPARRRRAREAEEGARPARRWSFRRLRPTLARVAQVRGRRHAPREAPPSSAPPTPDRLAALVEAEERKELLAEEALRERLARYRTRAVG